jgi:hypothetical protein
VGGAETRNVRLLPQLYAPEFVEGEFSEVQLQDPAQPPSYGTRKRPITSPRAERRHPHLVVQHKDALSCIGKGRRYGISFDGQRYQIGGVGDLVGGTGTLPGAQATANLTATFPYLNLSKIRIVCKTR